MQTYLWVKTVHVIAIISWMAGLLYLYRLYVYHAMESEAVVRSRFEVMERRLLRAIATPAAVVAVVTGLSMVWLTPAWLQMPWFHLKFTLAMGLIASHVFAIYARTQLALNHTRWSHKMFRVLNEAPTLLMFFIVWLVIQKPALWG
jgi:protoporphyrinogen IX oxidase